MLLQELKEKIDKFLLMIKLILQQSKIAGNAPYRGFV